MFCRCGSNGYKIAANHDQKRLRSLEMHVITGYDSPTNCGMRTSEDKGAEKNFVSKNFTYFEFKKWILVNPSYRIQYSTSQNMLHIKFNTVYFMARTIWNFAPVLGSSLQRRGTKDRTMERVKQPPRGQEVFTIICETVEEHQGLVGISQISMNSWQDYGANGCFNLSGNSDSPLPVMLTFAPSKKLKRRGPKGWGKKKYNRGRSGWKSPSFITSHPTTLLHYSVHNESSQTHALFIDNNTTPQHKIIILRSLAVIQSLINFQRPRKYAVVNGPRTACQVIGRKPIILQNRYDR